MRRVVVTGLGLVTPLACGVEATWQRCSPVESGIQRIDKFDVSDLPCQIAGQVPRGDGAAAPSIPTIGWSRRSSARSTISSSSPWRRRRRRSTTPTGIRVTYEDQIVSGVLIGSGIGGIEGIAETALLLRDRGPRRVSPFFIPGRLINLASGYVSIAHALKGPNHAVVTACSTGAHAIGDAGRLIALGDADVMVAGGAESPVSRISARRLCRLPRAVDRISTTRPNGVAAL